MRSPRIISAALGAAALVLAGCGGTSEEADDVPATSAPSTSAPDPSPSTPTTSVEPTLLTTTSPSTPVPSSAASTVPADSGNALSALITAFSQYDAQQPYRVTTVTGQTMRVEALGIDNVQAADPSRPTTIVEVTSSGDQHIVLDLGPTFAAMATGNPEASAALDGVGAEMWIVGEVLTIDSTRYQAVADINPTFDLGPFAPGIGVIDLARLGDIGGPELVEALAGSSVPDPVELGKRLPESLDAVAQDPSDPLRFTATASYADVIAAQGSDIDTAARSIAVGLAPALGLDVDDLAEFYADYYRGTESDVEIVVGPDGALQSLRVASDLSGIYDAIFSPESGLALDGTEAELSQARAQFAGAEWTIETISTFAIDPSITVAAPPGDHEDRTDIALDFFAELVPG